MKMSKENFRRLENAIIEADIIKRGASYQKLGLSHKRFRWDCFWNIVSRERKKGAVSFEGFRAIYSELNDSHIDTALRSIIGADYLPKEKSCSYCESKKIRSDNFGGFYCVDCGRYLSSDQLNEVGS